LSIGRLRAAVADIVADGGVEQDRFLVNKGEVVLEAFQGQIPDVLIIDRNAAAQRVVKSGE